MSLLVEFLQANPRLLVITGAGISSPSGIPTYRDDAGHWQRAEPIQHRDFIRSHGTRQRYWARSLLGWPYMENAQPNTAHYALARLERAGHIELLVTQNVDRLHQRAGQRNIIDLHGRLDLVVCLECGNKSPRSQLQRSLIKLNPLLQHRIAGIRPDGDAGLADRHVHGFVVPSCTLCGGTLMPDVVFFGGGVPRERIDKATAAMRQADALLVTGSSLMVYSGYRFCRLAREWGKPLAILNRGKTRADALATLKISADCMSELAGLCDRLGLCRPQWFHNQPPATAEPTASINCREPAFDLIHRSPGCAGRTAER